jgi:arylformamidase
MSMKVYDVSLTVSPDLPTWPTDPKILLEQVEKIEAGGIANVSRMDSYVHAGTHIDAPIHFIPGGAAIESIPLDILIGTACVVEIPDTEATITKAVLSQLSIPMDCKRILFKTSNSNYWAHGERKFQENFVALSEDGAEYLISRGICLVGIDYLSIAPFHQPMLTHVTLLKAKVVIVEGLDLSEVDPGNYQLICLPIKLGGSDGAPARVVLIKN